ncbi:hypothetical protein H4R22_000652 [Coemansia sp. RSA 1290]|nr:hypothetical protein H4R22_000652 [Coemansia sp. RSA 1290]KAJ2647226.1 hypothetical protein IWW40_004845 [Coemansia sp. RSA 1250]
MAENDNLRRQIQSLEQAINRRKQQYRPSVRFNPLRPPIRPSRNMKLTVRSNNNSSGSEESSSGYVSYANKLVRVGCGAASIRPQCRPRTSQASKPLSRPRQVVIDGETYRGNGNKLVRISQPPSSKPKPPVPYKRVVEIDGEKYVRTKRGSLVRIGAVQALNHRLNRPSARKRLCTRFLFGKCQQTAEECRYSHDLSPNVVPICMHYQLDRCTKSTCPFVHVKVNPNAPICRDFVYRGYCAKGSKCHHRHVLECPDWVEKGKCLKEGCRLPHPAKKSSQQLPTKEEEEQFLKQYIQRPVFDKAAQGEAEAGVEMKDSDDESSEALEDLSEDEAEELLKWYDDNYIEADEK